MSQGGRGANVDGRVWEWSELGVVDMLGHKRRLSPIGGDVGRRQEPLQHPGLM